MRRSERMQSYLTFKTPGKKKKEARFQKERTTRGGDGKKCKNDFRIVRGPRSERNPYRFLMDKKGISLSGRKFRELPGKKRSVQDTN